MMFAQTEPIWNPTLWPEFIRAVGIPGFFALVFFAALAYVWWKGRPVSNKAQVRMLKLVYADAQERNARMRKVLRSFCDIVAVFAVSDSLSPEARTKIELSVGRIQDALDAAPPPIPDELTLDEET
jgi:hypothetical protein